MSLPWAEAAALQRDRQRIRAAWWRGWRAAMRQMRQQEETAVKATGDDGRAELAAIWREVEAEERAAKASPGEAAYWYSIRGLKARFMATSPERAVALKARAERAGAGLKGVGDDGA